MIRLLLILLLLCTSCTSEDPPLTRSASAPTDTAGLKITVEVPDTTHVINKTY